MAKKTVTSVPPLDYYDPNVMRRMLRYGYFKIKSEWVPAVIAAIDSYESLRDNPRTAPQDSLARLREALTHRSTRISPWAIQLGRLLTRKEGIFFDLLDQLSVDRKVTIRRLALDCIHRESFVPRSLPIIEKLATDLRSAGCRYKSYDNALLLEGRNVKHRLAAWLEAETDPDCLELLNNLKELTENGFRYSVDNARFDAFNRNGEYVRLSLPSRPRSDLTTEKLLSIANEQTEPNTFGHFQFSIAEMEQHLNQPVADSADLVCSSCDEAIPWGWLHEDPCPHCGKQTFMGSQDVSKWMARVAKDEVKNFAVDPDDFKPPKRL